MRRLSYYRDKFDVSRSPDFEVPSELSFIEAEDGTRIALSALGGDGDRAFLVIHGLLAHHRSPGIREFNQALTRYGRVWSPDLRGHGLSAGASTLGNLEALDVAAAIEHIKRETEQPLIAIGFSMGAAALVRAAALFEEVGAVVSISGPADWNGERRWAARRTSLMWKLPLVPTLVRHLTGVRIDPNWRASESPASVIGKISPTPVLVVHGHDDDFFPPSEAMRLYDSAGEPRGIWMIQGDHAEGLFADPRAEPSQVRADAFAAELLSRLDDLT